MSSGRELFSPVISSTHFLGGGEWRYQQSGELSPISLIQFRLKLSSGKTRLHSITRHHSPEPFSLLLPKSRMQRKQPNWRMSNWHPRLKTYPWRIRLFAVPPQSSVVPQCFFACTEMVRRSAGKTAEISQSPTFEE